MTSPPTSGAFHNASSNSPLKFGPNEAGVEAPSVRGRAFVTRWILIPDPSNLIGLLKVGLEVLHRAE